MQQSSLALQAAVQSDYVMCARVKLVRNGIVIRELQVHAGGVDADITAENMRRFTADVADPTGELTPYDLDDECAPFGTEVIVERGATLPVIVEAVDIDETVAQWYEGTRVNTTVDSSGDLVLGFD